MTKSIDAEAASKAQERPAVRRDLAAMRDSQAEAATPATPGTNNAHLSVRVSLVMVQADADAGKLDAVAGSEFLDDRLRLEE